MKWGEKGVERVTREVKCSGDELNGKWAEKGELA
jgi:hypothetical protein